jgi:hypothetical protein
MLFFLSLPIFGSAEEAAFPGVPSEERRPLFSIFGAAEAAFPQKHERGEVNKRRHRRSILP